MVYITQYDLMVSSLHVIGAEIADEINRLQTSYFQTFNSGLTLSVYYPVKLNEVCERAEAPNIFKLVLSCMTSPGILLPAQS